MRSSLQKSLQKYIVAFLTISIFVIISACQENAPTDCQCVKVVYDTTNFDLNVSLNTINKFDEKNYSKNGIDDRDSIKIKLYKNNTLINEVFTKNGQYNFEKLDKNGVYKLIYEKDGFIPMDTALNNIIYTRRKSFDYEVVKHSDYVSVSNTIYQPYILPKIKSITATFKLDSTVKGHYEYYHYYSLISEVSFNEARFNQIAVVSVSKEPNFEKSKCILYNEYIRTYNDINVRINKSSANLSGFNKGDKVYIRAYPVVNGTLRSQHLEELGEPVFFEAVAE